MSSSLIFQALVNGMLMGGVYAFAGLGLNIIFGVMKILNFAHGSLMMLAMYIVFWLFNLWKIDPYFSVFLVIPILFILGRIIYRLLIDRVLNDPEYNQLLLTLGVSLFLENFALVMWGADFRTIQVSYSQSSFAIGDIHFSLPRVIAFIFAWMLSALIYLMLKKSDLGKALRSASEDRLGAQLSGIPVRRLFGIAFGLGVACVAAAGALITPFFYISPTAGATFTIMSFIVVVLGGMGNIGGGLMGGLIIGIVEALGTALLPGSLKELVIFMVFVAILLFRPSGILVKTNG